MEAKEAVWAEEESERLKGFGRKNLRWEKAFGWEKRSRRVG